jgi:hypothetical protein
MAKFTGAAEAVLSIPGPDFVMHKGITYDDADPAVADAVRLYPDMFIRITPGRPTK